MSATTISAPSNPAAFLTHGLRIALIALVIVVLLAVSFVSGRATGTTTKGSPAAVPTAGASTSAPCHMGRPC